MSELKERLKDISEIRNLMEKSSKFLSLSGLAGIGAGFVALIGAAAAWYYLDGNPGNPYLGNINAADFLSFFFLDAGLTLLSALGIAAFFSIRFAKKKGLPLWNKTARYMLIDLAIPLVCGLAFALIQLYHGKYLWVAGTTLIFYGLALLNASKYTLKEIRYLGVSELIVGLLSCIWVGYGLYFWAVGFGLLHMVYGAVMYFKYER